MIIAQVSNKDKHTTESINQAKSWSFEQDDKRNKALVGLIQKRQSTLTSIRNENGALLQILQIRKT